MDNVFAIQISKTIFKCGILPMVLKWIDNIVYIFEINDFLLKRVNIILPCNQY